MDKAYHYYLSPFAKMKHLPKLLASKFQPSIPIWFPNTNIACCPLKFPSSIIYCWTIIGIEQYLV